MHTKEELASNVSPRRYLKTERYFERCIINVEAGFFVKTAVPVGLPFPNRAFSKAIVEVCVNLGKKKHLSFYCRDVGGDIIENSSQEFKFDTSHLLGRYLVTQVARHDGRTKSLKMAAIIWVQR
jgi:hypothetical protein